MGIGAVKAGGVRAVFLDRDGVLNHAVVRDGKPFPPASVDQLRLYPDAAAALARLKRAGYLRLVVTNQPDVARGTTERAVVEAINGAIGAALGVDDFFVCWHDDADGCGCRKPKPGLLKEAAERYGVDLSRSFLIGDRWRDIDAGAAAGCRTVLIDRGYRERAPEHAPDFRAESIGEAAEWVLQTDPSQSVRQDKPGLIL
jgi:D-glycero-D-manno-heptose 1,7-bisphosphate phosphatase